MTTVLKNLPNYWSLPSSTFKEVMAMNKASTSIMYHLDDSKASEKKVKRCFFAKKKIKRFFFHTIRQVVNKYWYKIVMIANNLQRGYGNEEGLILHYVPFGWFKNVREKRKTLPFFTWRKREKHKTYPFFIRSSKLWINIDIELWWLQTTTNFLL